MFNVQGFAIIKTIKVEFLTDPVQTIYLCIVSTEFINYASVLYTLPKWNKKVPIEPGPILSTVYQLQSDIMRFLTYYLIYPH